MPNTQSLGNSKAPFVGIAALLLLGGGAYGVWSLAQKHALDTTTATVNLGAASTEIQKTAENTFTVFLTDVRRHAFDQALQSTSSNYPSPHSSSSLMTLTQTKLTPLVTGGDLQFEPVHLAARGQKLYLRAKVRFNGKPYRTVCTFTKQNTTWRISDILPPVAPGIVKSHVGFATSKSR